MSSSGAAISGEGTLGQGQHGHAADLGLTADHAGVVGGTTGAHGLAETLEGVVVASGSLRLRDRPGLAVQLHRSELLRAAGDDLVEHDHVVQVLGDGTAVLLDGGEDERAAVAAEAGLDGLGDLPEEALQHVVVTRAVAVRAGVLRRLMLQLRFTGGHALGVLVGAGDVAQRQLGDGGAVGLEEAHLATAHGQQQELQVIDRQRQDGPQVRVVADGDTRGEVTVRAEVAAATLGGVDGQAVDLVLPEAARVRQGLDGGQEGVGVDVRVALGQFLAGLLHQRTQSLRVGEGLCAATVRRDHDGDRGPDHGGQFAEIISMDGI